MRNETEIEFQMSRSSMERNLGLCVRNRMLATQIKTLTKEEKIHFCMVGFVIQLSLSYLSVPMQPIVLYDDLFQAMIY